MTDNQHLSENAELIERLAVDGSVAQSIPSELAELEMKRNQEVDNVFDLLLKRVINDNKIKNIIPRREQMPSI